MRDGAQRADSFVDGTHAAGVSGRMLGRELQTQFKTIFPDGLTGGRLFALSGYHQIARALPVFWCDYVESENSTEVRLANFRMNVE
jgi:hypothetical protein